MVQRTTTGSNAPAPPLTWGSLCWLGLTGSKMGLKACDFLSFLAVSVQLCSSHLNTQGCEGLKCSQEPR